VHIGPVRFIVQLAAWLCLIGAAACGANSQQQPDTPGSRAPSPQAVEPTLPKLPPGHVWREQVMAVMSPGIAMFLRRIEVRESMVNGRFHGFRIIELRGDPALWSGVDLLPGDVVTSINGQPIGHYDQAYRVWQSLAAAPALVVAYERNGETRELHYDIHDAPADGGTLSLPVASAAGAGSAVRPPPAPSASSPAASSPAAPESSPPRLK
jgi:hypothetical protein